MKTAKILLPDVESVKRFVDLANECDFELTLVSGRYQVNAKSIMGIFSLDLTSPMTLELQTDSEGEANDLLAKADAFLVK